MPKTLAVLTGQAARAAGVEPELLAALVWVESRYCPRAVSPKGAIGLGQLMPQTAQELGVDPWDPQQNLWGAARYLKAMHARFGSWPLALAAYNAGPGAVARYRGVPPYPETQRFVREVLRVRAYLVRQRDVFGPYLYWREYRADTQP